MNDELSKYPEDVLSFQEAANQVTSSPQLLCRSRF